jgi:cytochrome c-type biogenesis protein CcmH
MVNWLRVLLFTLLIASSSWSLEYGEALQRPDLEARAKRLYTEIRCPVCAGQSIGASQAQLAQDLRAEVRSRLIAGETDEEILRHLKERYGESVSFAPSLSPETALLWGLPFILMAGGLWLVWRRRSQLI